MARRAADESNVFLNVPYDSGYEPCFLALLSALVALGRVPRCVLEITEAGQGRLVRIMELLARCPVSIHDLSRTGTPPRFNMPFELGMAYGIGALAKRRPLIMVLERVPRRLQRTLSDWPAKDAMIHDGKPFGVIVGVLDLLGRPRGNPEPEAVYGHWRELMRVARQVKRSRRQASVFHRSAFLEIVDAALLLAAKRGWVKESRVK